VFIEDKSMSNVAIDAASSILSGKAVDGLTSGFNKAVKSDLSSNAAVTSAPNKTPLILPTDAIRVKKPVFPILPQ
jgi:hypothetical protein